MSELASPQQLTNPSIEDSTEEGVSVQPPPIAKATGSNSLTSETENCQSLPNGDHIMEEKEELTEEMAIEASEDQLKQQDSLKDQAKQFAKLWEVLNASYDKSEVTLYFLLSVPWLNVWKKHVSYEKVIKDENPNYSHFAKYNNELLFGNDDLLENMKQDTYYELNANNPDGTSIFLKQNLRENLNYIIVDRDIVDLFNQNYHNFKVIPRRAYLTPSGQKRTEIYYQQVNMVIVNHDLLKSIDMKQGKQVISKKIQLFSQETQENLRVTLAPLVKQNQQKPSNSQYIPCSVSSSTIRLWRFNDGYTPTTFFNDLLQATSKSPSFDYRLKLPILYIQREDESTTVEQLGLLNGTTFVVEVQKQDKWLFKIEGEQDQESCEFCRQFKFLKFQCICQKVKYCSPECKQKDSQWHSKQCESAGCDPEDDSPVPYNFIAESVRGVCGLSNLGNTCFMNSALQCLSNSPILTPYFLEKKFLAEINKENPLGRQGKLAKKFAIFLKNLWIGSSSVFYPVSLKNEIAQFQSMFYGYSQHDSQEFLSFMLDGLHEDLNRVKVKQVTESVDSKGRDDHIVARESWANHLKRNQSVIVDLMQGQFKSKVKCPDCNKESITFDPYLTCSLPIPNNKIKKVTAYFLFANNREASVEVTYIYTLNKKATVLDFKQHCATTLNTQVNKLALFSLSQTDIRSKFDNDVLLKEFKKQTKYGLRSAVMVEYSEEEELAGKGYSQIPVQFYRHNYDEYFKKMQTFLSTFTYTRPFYILDSSSTKDIHLKIFEYLVPLFIQGLKNQKQPIEEENKQQDNDTSSFVEDSSTLDLETLYQKYILSAKKKPYSVRFDTDAHSYTKKPCSFCGSDSCKNCEVPYQSDEPTLGQLKSKIKPGSYNKLVFKIHISTETVLGGFISSLDAQNNSNSYASDSHNKKMGDESVSLESCFQLFETPERLGEDNEWYCSNCRQHKKAEKQMFIYRAPEILILHLKRFKESGGYFKSKLSSVVDYPLQGLDLTDYVIEKETPSEFYKDLTNSGQQQQQQESQKMEIESKEQLLTNQNERLLFDLYAVTNHYGSLGGGHYTAYSMNQGKWYCFDDSSVSQVNSSQIVSEASYILFYKRRRQESSN